MSKELELKKLLMNSHWPKCNNIAEELFLIGSDAAKEVLIDALKAKRHHIRTASLKALAKFKDPSLLKHLEPLINDSAYETRTEAEKIIHALKEQ